jgi:signal transduction histidine kinase
VSDGDLSARATVPDGPPELRALTVQFNEMVVKLDGLVRSQRDFVADASHELRTPLTALRLRLENLERDVAAAGRPTLDAALAEIERLSGIVESLLALARADAGSTPAATSDAAAVASERVETWRAVAGERGIGLRFSGSGPQQARASAEHLAQVLDNLLSNAVDASPAGGDVTVTVATAGTTVELHVRDSGPGLAPEQRERAFDRFWRAGTGGGGSGLGLAIARRLVEAHGGTIQLDEAAGGGVEAVVRLPAVSGS